MEDSITLRRSEQRRVQVLTQLAGGVISSGQAAALLSLSERQVRCLTAALGSDGPAGLIHGNPMVPEGKNHLGPVLPTLTFAHVPEGKTVKNRLHIDVNPTDREQDEEVRRLLDLGARHADVGQGDESWIVLADPEGNEFCVLAGRRP
jgi:Glyoxalase-like domain